MRPTSACLSLLLLAFHSASAGTAFDAVKILAPEQLQRVAVIAGRDGTPEPERWHILVYDPASLESGVREIVVAAGKKVAERPISQFAEKVSTGDVMPLDSFKVDSDKITKMAMKFGTANSVTVSAMHFDLRRGGPESAALWTVTCLDAAGTELGKLIVSAAKGTVLLHPGFVAEPELDPIAEDPQVATRTTTAPQVSEESGRGSRRSGPRQPPPVRTAQPVAPAATPKPGFLQRLFTPPDKSKTPPR